MPIRSPSSDMPGEPGELVDEDRSRDLASVNGFDLPLARKASPAYQPVPGDEIVTQKQAPSGWRPIYLRRRVLLGFLAIYLVLLASTETIYQISQRSDGLVASVPSRHYLWTYGPTSVVSIIVAFWARVVYQSRLTAPWAALKDAGATQGSRSIFLDYFSMLEIAVPFAALRNADYLVAASSVCGWILKIGVIFSTGLIALYPTAIRRDNVPVTLLNSFCYSRGNLSDLGTMPAHTIRGIMENTLSYPDGTNHRFAYQAIEAAPTIPANPQLEVKVDGFSADLDCEPGNFTVHEWWTVSRVKPLTYGEPDFIKNLTLFSPTCNISGFQPGSTVKNNYWAEAQPAHCGAENTTEAFRVVLLAGQITKGDMNETVYPPGIYNKTTVTRAMVLVCKPTYVIGELKVTFNTTDSTTNKNLDISLVGNSENRTLDKLHGADIARSLFQVLSDYGKLIKEPLGWGLVGSSDDDFYLSDLIVAGLALKAGKALEFEQFLEAGTLKDIALRAYAAVTAQIAHDFLMVNETSHSTGSASYTEDRLVVRALSVRVLEGLLTLVSVLTLGLLMLTYRSGVTSRDISTLLGMATILARSGRFVKTLKGAGAWGVPTLRQHMSGYRFESKFHQESFGIFVSDCENAADKRPPLPTGTPFKQWWRPFVVRPGGYLMACLVLAVLIGVLEGILRLSRQNDGIGNATTGGYVQYAWAYIPALTMATVGLYFIFLDFTVKCLAPYSTLGSGTTVRRSLGLNFLDMLSPNVAFNAIRNRHWSVVASTTATITATFLTIAASDLYTMHNIPVSHPVQLQRKSVFDREAGDNVPSTSPEVSAGVITAGLILHRNISYPQWTHGEFAFSNLSLISKARMEVLNPGKPGINSIRAKVPAVRSRIDCKIWDSQGFRVNMTWGDVKSQQNHDIYHNPLEVDVPEEKCHSQRLVEIANNGYFGKTYEDGGVCSNIVLMWGKVTNRKVDYVKVMGCNETITELKVDTTFNMPGFEIDISHPLAADESTASRLNIYFPTGQIMDYLPDVRNHHFDNFFSTLLSNQKLGPLLLTDLEDEPELLLKVQRKAQQTYQVIRAQQFSNSSRFSVNASMAGDPISGVAVDSGNLRVVQDAASTHVLAGLLAVILLCNIIIAVMTDRQGVVPKNPCSIAATASLLVDSNLLDEGVLPAHAEWMSDEELYERSGAGEWEVRMGSFSVDESSRAESESVLAPGSEVGEIGIEELSTEEEHVRYGRPAQVFTIRLTGATSDGKV